MLKLKWCLIPVILAMLALAGGACKETEEVTTPVSQGTINVYVTDAPAREKVTGIWVTISEIQVHKAVAEQEQEQQQTGSDNQTQVQEQEKQQTQLGGGEWITISLSDNSTEFNLMDVAGIEQYIGTKIVEEGKYTQVRVVVDEAQVQLGEGEDAELHDATVPSGEIKIVHAFDVIAGETTTLVLDFDAGRMVTVSGADRVIVKPVINLKVRQEKSGSQQAGIDAGKVEDKRWVLEWYGEPGNLKAVLPNTEITATFKGAEGQVSGSAGCNTYSGTFKRQGNNLSVPGPIAVTAMYCSDEIDEQERAYLTILESAKSYIIEDGELTINCGEKVLIFESE
jgi:heat shock protein HslJ